MNISVVSFTTDVSELITEYKTCVEDKLMAMDTTPPILVQKMFCISNNKRTQDILSSMPITKNLIAELKKIITFSNVTYRCIMPNTCYTWHIDKPFGLVQTEFNYHIPIITNEGCHFVYKNQSYHMPADGSLYKVNNSIPHSFMNAGRTPRVHILFENLW